MKKIYFLALLFIVFLVLTACNNEATIPDKTNWPLEDFSHTNQNGEDFSLTNDVKGEVTVVNMIFTNCSTVCSPMTANMARLQRMATEQELNIKFLSFSVDPEIDDPATLKEFGDMFDADYSNWNFITGYSQKYIEEYAMKNFKAIVAKPKNDPEVIHGTRMYLVNEEGVVVKNYDGLDVPYEEILEHAQILLNK